MDRKGFIKTCGYFCLGTAIFIPPIHGCTVTKSITAPIDGEKLLIPISAFVHKGKSLKYIVVSNAQLQHPIYVYKFSEFKYSALYMKCTHQGNELSAYGEKLVCSAHGSEFDNHGNNTHGPANSPLRSFPTILENKFITISLLKP